MKPAQSFPGVAAAACLSLLLAACNLPISGVVADNAAPVISNMTASSESIFYNDSTCGPTTLTISMNVGDDSGRIQSAGMQYRYNDYGQSGSPSDSWRTLNFSNNGGGDFFGTVDVAAEAQAVLNGAGGALEYQAFAIDSAGNVKTFPAQTTYALIVQSCDDGIAGAPPASGITGTSILPPTPAGSRNNTGAVSTTPTTPGYSGGESASQPTETSLPAIGNTPPPTLPPAGNENSGGAAPTPTTEPPPPDTLIGGNLAQTPKGLDFKSLSASPTTIYDGGCSNMGPIGATIQFELINPSVLKEAQLMFHYLNNSKQVVGQDYGTNFYYTGTSVFSFDITPVTGQSQPSLNGSEGQIEYWVVAQDTDGNWVVSDYKYISVLPCQALGQPVTAPYIEYFSGPTTSVSEGERIYLEWSVSDAPCGVALDGNAVPAAGEHSYVIPGNVAPLTITHTLEAFGGDCSNPIPVTETVTFDVDVLPITFNAPLNNSSSGYQDVNTSNFWYGQILAGDDEYDHKLGAIIWFNISSLQNVGELQSATLNLGGCSEVGNPFSVQPFTIAVVSSNIGLHNVGTINGNCTGTFDVTDVVFAHLGSSEILFTVSPGGTNYDGTPDQVYYSSPSLSIVYLPGQ